MVGNITAVVVEPRKVPEIREIDGSLKGLQELVGGDIEVIYPYDDMVALVCDEESKLKGKPLNRALRGEDKKVYDIVAGTFAIVGLGEDDWKSLDDELAEKYSDLFAIPEKFVRFNGKLVILPVFPEDEIEDEDEYEPEM